MSSGPRPRMASMEFLDLVDWKRQIFAAYADVRGAGDPQTAWRGWREVRDKLFASHPQSPIPPTERDGFGGRPYFDYDPAARVEAEVHPAEPRAAGLPTSGQEPMTMTRVATARFRIGGTDQALDCWWLTGYGGGLFVPFRDATSGTETYGAGRYLLDTIKGADLGTVDGGAGGAPEVAAGRLLFDFNFAYQPSCSYDPRWVCPLAPAGNRLDVAVRAGERMGAPPS